MGAERQLVLMPDPPATIKCTHCAVTRVMENANRGIEGYLLFVGASARVRVLLDLGKKEASQVSLRVLDSGLDQGRAHIRRNAEDASGFQQWTL